MSELERERHKNTGLERARDSWYQEWFKGTERITELEAELAALRAENRRLTWMMDKAAETIVRATGRYRPEEAMTQLPEAHIAGQKAQVLADLESRWEARP